MKTLVDIWVPGHPKTKGSLTNQGGRMVESVRGSGDWRRAIADRAEADMRNRHGIDPRGVEPFDGPVSVTFIAVLPTEDVTHHGTGDVDKLARNLLDALQDARVYRDDTQVVVLNGAEASMYATGLPAGMLIRADPLSLSMLAGVSSVAAQWYAERAHLSRLSDRTPWG